VFVAAVLCVSLATGCTSSKSASEPSEEGLFRDSTEELRKGDLARALSLSDRGIGLAGGTSSVRAVGFRLLKAEVLLNRREAEAAAALISTAIPDGAGYDTLRSRRRLLEGRLEILRGRLQPALDTLVDAARMAKTAGAADVELDAAVFQGQVLLRLQRWDDGESILQGAAAAAEASADSFRHALALHSLGMGRLLRRRFDEAAPFFERVLAARDLGAYAIHATALTNAALCYAQLGESDRAIGLLRRAVETHERLNARVYLEQALGELGSAYVVRGDFDNAIVHLTRALDVARAAGQNADASLWAANLASAYLELQRWDDAERLSAEARRLGGDARNRPFFVLFDARILEGRGRFDDAARLYREASLLGRDVPNVQWRVSARLGWMAHHKGQAAAAASHFEKALAIVEQNRASLRDQDFRLSIQARGIDLYHQYVDVLIAGGQIERALSVADSGRAAVLSERHGVTARPRATPSALRRLARQAGAVALFYWFGDARSFAWVVTPDRIGLIPLQTTGSQVETLVAEYRRLVVDALGDPLRMAGSPGDRLYELLIAPVTPWIPTGSRVILVPDGSLGTLNLEALPVPGRRRYWIEDVELTVAPSLGALASLPLRSATPESPSLLLIGDPVTADPQFPALKYAPAEMQAIASAFGDRASVRRRDAASPAGYRAASPGSFEIIHFTAHAAANAASPLDSAVILSPGESGYKLYAREVAQLPLVADLVTISACRSAGERTYAGEGLVGFAWAFLRAGARRVIAGLWDVDDRSTADLMAGLYTRIAQGDRPEAALRAAKLAMLRSATSTAKPYYWAPFQVFVGQGS
jgi:CHAT domain-containing protein